MLSECEILSAHNLYRAHEWIKEETEMQEKIIETMIIWGFTYPLESGYQL
jgi:hypothetical protein